MKLTAHFDRDEFGDVPPQYEGHVVALSHVLEAFRRLAGVPFVITQRDGRVVGVYRDPVENAETAGASPTSQHLTADAADGEFFVISNRELARRTLAALAAGTLPAFGQLILYDYDAHVHISNPRTDGPNNEILYARHDASGAPWYERITDARQVPMVSSFWRNAAGALVLAVAATALAVVRGGR